MLDSLITPVSFPWEDTRIGDLITETLRVRTNALAEMITCNNAILRHLSEQNINLLSGRDEAGNIAPPDPTIRIDRTAFSFWRNSALVTKG